MKEETIDCFVFLHDAVAALVYAALVLRQLVLQDIGLRLKMSPWTYSRSLRKMRNGPKP